MSNLGTKLLLNAARPILLAFVAVTLAAQSSAPASSGAAAPAQQSSNTPAAASSTGQSTAGQNSAGQNSATPATGDAQSSNQSSTQSSNPAAVITARINEVNVVFTVTDKHGRHITDLKLADFRVVDDNKPPAAINSFNAETKLPLQVGLLIDASNSVRDRFKFEQESAIEFLNQTIRPRYDSAFVIGFDATPEVAQDFTDNTEALARGVHELRPGGGTALFDALYYACRDKLLKAPNATPVRRAIILLTDGEDNLSHVTREEAIDMAQRAEAIVYTISTNISGTKGAGDKVLERIAEATGGRAFFPFQIRDVVNDFTEIQEELRSQYAISYKPAELKKDGHYRTIEIIATNRRDLRVRSRRGWFSPTQ
jgi:Ca-activated chloride channel homolog